VNILKKKNFLIARQKNLVPHMQKCSNIKIVAKIEGKEAKKFFRQLTKGI
jgi:hypothetical protein